MSEHAGLKWGAGVTGVVLAGGMVYAASRGGESATEELSAGQQLIAEQEALDQVASADVCGEGFNYDTFAASSFEGVAPKSLFKDLQVKDVDGGWVAVSVDEARKQVMTQACGNAAVAAVGVSYLVEGRKPGIKIDETTSLTGIEGVYTKLVTDPTYAAESLAALDDEIDYMQADTAFSFSNASARAIAPTISGDGETTGLKYVEGNFVRPQDGWRFGYNTDDSGMTSVERASLDQQMLTFALNKQGQWVVAKTVGEGKVTFDKDEQNAQALKQPKKPHRVLAAQKRHKLQVAHEQRDTRTGTSTGTTEKDTSDNDKGTRPTGGRTTAPTTGPSTGTAPEGGATAGPSTGPAPGGGESTAPAPQPEPEVPVPQPTTQEPTPEPSTSSPAPQPSEEPSETPKGSEPPKDCENNPFDPRC